MSDSPFLASFSDALSSLSLCRSFEQAHGSEVMPVKPHQIECVEVRHSVAERSWLIMRLCMTDNGSRAYNASPRLRRADFNLFNFTLMISRSKSVIVATLMN